jgi:hypothetical protein
MVYKFTVASRVRSTSCVLATFIFDMQFYRSLVTVGSPFDWSWSFLQHALPICKDRCIYCWFKPDYCSRGKLQNVNIVLVILLCTLLGGKVLTVTFVVCSIWCRSCGEKGHWVESYQKCSEFWRGRHPGCKYTLQLRVQDFIFHAGLINSKIHSKESQTMKWFKH